MVFRPPFYRRQARPRVAAFNTRLQTELSGTGTYSAWSASGTITVTSELAGTATYSAWQSSGALDHDGIDEEPVSGIGPALIQAVHRLTRTVLSGFSRR